MKSLTLLRHAKSGWDDPVARDFDRTLNGRGQRAAMRIGRYLRDESLAFDHVIASPAVRVMETIEHLAAGYGQPIDPIWERRIYLASSATLLELVTMLPASATHVLMVGHNPGLEDLVLELVPEDADPGLREEVEIKFPTASLAELRFDTDDWGAVSSAPVTLARFVRPRDLDASLGPDDD